MVTKPHPTYQPYEVEIEEIYPFKWISIAVQEFIEKEYRLDASVYEY